jgi:uncharacterized protein (TIGR00369 family)
MDDTKTRIAAQFVAALPFARALGMRVEAVGDGEAVLAMDYDPRLTGDRDGGVVHGGVVSALLDTCSGAAVMSHPSMPLSTATLDLRIDYMRPAAPGEAITARASVYHMTRSAAFVRATAHDADAARPVACATAVFTVERGKGGGA